MLLARLMTLLSVVTGVATTCIAAPGIRAFDPPPPDSGIKNGNFAERDDSGGPVAWMVPTPGFVVRVVDDDKAVGGHAAELSTTGGGGGEGARSSATSCRASRPTLSAASASW